MAFVVQPNYRPSDSHTQALVASFVDSIDKRKKVSPEALSDVLCGCLALRNTTFKINQNKWNAEHKKAAEAIKDTLVGSFLKREGQYSYTIHSSVDPKSFVVDTSEPNLKFRVQSEHCRWANTASIPSADIVGTLSGRRAVKLIIPNVAKTFEHLHIDGGQQLDVRFETVPYIHVGLIAKDLSRLYREEIMFLARRYGWLAVLIENDDIDTYEFAVTDTHAKEFTEFVAMRTRKWFGQHNLPHIKFPSVIDTALGYTVTVPGFHTAQHLQANIDALKAASNG
jgi:hypothetical protein